MRARMALKLADIKCEIREVRLNNKPEDMLKASPKGTVPVLVLKNRVIDESNEIIDWVLEGNKIFNGNSSNTIILYTRETINIFDYQFNYHLDRYN